jgi:hypothetical protein
MTFEKIERLSEELIWVFDFKNEDNCNISQKEELLQQVLQLGGDNYTFEDLIRDLLSFEEGNKPNKNTDDMAARRLCEIEDRATLDHQSITK